MDTLQAIKNYLALEQRLGVDKAKQHEHDPQIFDSTYYRGYYNGYLAALYNLNVVIELNEEKK